MIDLISLHSTRLDGINVTPLRPSIVLSFTAILSIVHSNFIKTWYHFGATYAGLELLSARLALLWVALRSL